MDNTAEIYCSACDGRGIISPVSLSQSPSACPRCDGTRLEPDNVEPVHAWDRECAGAVMRCGRSREAVVYSSNGTPSWRITSAGPISRADGVTCRECLTAALSPYYDLDYWRRKVIRTLSAHDKPITWATLFNNIEVEHPSHHVKINVILTALNACMRAGLVTTVNEADYLLFKPASALIHLAGIMDQSTAHDSAAEGGTIEH